MHLLFLFEIGSKNKKQASFEKLLPEDQDKVRQVMDRFSISGEAYHELTQVDGCDLPKSYLVEGCMRHHDEKIGQDIRRTPGEATGCELPIKPLLIVEIKCHVSINTGNKIILGQTKARCCY